ncbi:MAG: DegT/DnrJ/EryC1/StrS family aminotransferase [Planctomycetota bacterium]
MPVPFVDLKAQYAPLRESIRAAIDRVCDAQAFVLGAEVEQFEADFAAYCRCKHAIGVTSGSDALIMALMALDVSAGDEVITSPFTFFATAGAIHRLGAKPVFADITATTFNLDPTEVTRHITPRTKAILPVHLFGQCADMEGLREVAGDIPIIEDSAQSIGAEATIDGRAMRTGAMGHMACVSFYPAKNLGCFGDGGAVTTDDDNLAARLRRLRNHGQTTHGQYLHEEVGGNFRLDALQAAVLRVKLPHLDSWTAGREVNAQRYTERLAGHGILASEGGCVHLPAEVQPRHVWNQYTLRITGGSRDAVMKALRAKGVGCVVYYPLALHQQPCFAVHGQSAAGTCPVAEAACNEVLSLPVAPELTESQQDEVIDALVAAVKNAS